MPDQRSPRGRVQPTIKNPGAPNAEPVFLPEPPKKLIFGQHLRCSWCKGKGKKGGKICGVCKGTTIVIDESAHRDDHTNTVAS